jgi:hypothetical protein
MTREDLILDCRYYSGEEEVPNTLPKGKEIFWDYERVWVKWVLEGYPNLQKSIDHYTEAYNLPNLLPESDGTPLGIKAILFNRYDHWIGYMGGPKEKYAQEFKEWYLSLYVAGAKTHRQLMGQQNAGGAKR